MGTATIHQFGKFISGLFDVQLQLEPTNKSRKLSVAFEIFDTSILVVHFIIPYKAKRKIHLRYFKQFQTFQ